MSTEEFKPNLYVLARIINTLMGNGGMRRTNLATASGLSYDKLQRYLDWMTSKGLVVIDGDGYVRLTNDGVRAYEELVKWVIKYVGSLKVGRYGEG
ncbi:winged helix-turn-helix domain-containing protein [Caldivirga sp.]|uniref:winged helix-turn-helix domain-containing protein n=1 Tax=Caldivirga sp. TaxID=2080243 RepID=UPI0025BA1BB1|nr:winged helix-turn-helix domain-containing protein [Caldivirga sp.]